MIRLFAKLLCRARGHVWGRAYEQPMPDGMGGTIHHKDKACKRCGEIRAVKQRKTTAREIAGN